MDSPSGRTLQLLGVVTAVLLVALLFYPGTFSSPYADRNAGDYSHALASEWEREGEIPVYQYGELSPPARDLFDRTRSAGGSYRPDVCQGFMPVCDGYYEDELPDEFAHGSDLSPAESHVIIDDGPERYVLETGQSGHADGLVSPSGVISFITLVPFAIFLVFVVGAARIHRTPTADRALGASVAGGVTLGVLSLAAPYLEMYGVVTAQRLGRWIIAVLYAGFVELSFLREVVIDLL